MKKFFLSITLIVFLNSIKLSSQIQPRAFNPNAVYVPAEPFISPGDPVIRDGYLIGTWHAYQFHPVIRGYSFIIIHLINGNERTVSQRRLKQLLMNPGIKIDQNSVGSSSGRNSIGSSSGQSSAGNSSGQSSAGNSSGQSSAGNSSERNSIGSSSSQSSAGNLSGQNSIGSSSGQSSSGNSSGQSSAGTNRPR